jgi:Icc-related predicted phosphoesterase
MSTRIVSLSDPHNQLDQIQIPHADVLLICGDLTEFGTRKELEHFNKQLRQLPHENIVVIPGNHDNELFENPNARKLFDPSMHYLVDSSVVLNGLRFYGHPWVPGMGQGNFNAFTLPPGSQELSDRCKAIPEDTDILVSHSPPFGILDGRERGCTSLRWRLADIQPKVVVFGHVHSGYGEYTDPETGVRYFNAAICGARNKPVNQPWVIDID